MKAADPNPQRQGAEMGRNNTKQLYYRAKYVETSFKHMLVDYISSNFLTVNFSISHSLLVLLIVLRIRSLIIKSIPIVAGRLLLLFIHCT